MLGHVGQCCRRRRFKGKACTIYEFHTGKAPRFDAFRVPGCLFITVNLNVTAKLAPRGILCVWVALAKGGVLVLVLATGKLSVVRLEDCVIYEHIRPFKRETTQQLAEALAFKQIDQQDMGEAEAVEWMDVVDRVYNTARVFDERHIYRFPLQGENLLEDSEVKEFRVPGVPVVTPPQMMLEADEADGVVFKDVEHVERVDRPRRSRVQHVPGVHRAKPGKSVLAMSAEELERWMRVEELEKFSKLFDKEKVARTAFDFSDFEDVRVCSTTAATDVSGEGGRAKWHLDQDPDFKAERDALEEFGSNAWVLDQDSRYVFVFSVSMANWKDLKKTAGACSIRS